MCMCLRTTAAASAAWGVSPWHNQAATHAEEQQASAAETAALRFELAETWGQLGNVTGQRNAERAEAHRLGAQVFELQVSASRAHCVS
jgi:hypothetical protein